MINFQYKILLAIIGLAFIISLTHSFYFRLEPIVDASAYDRIALNLVSGYGYLEWRDVPVQKDFAIGRVGPGYELFLAGVYKIFGHYYEAVWILQAIFHALTAWLVFLLTREIFTPLEIAPPNRNAVGPSSKIILTRPNIYQKFLTGLNNNWRPLIGWAAAALVAFSPDLILASSMLLTENFAVFLLVAALYFFFRFFNDKGWVDLLSTAVFFSSAVLVRSQLALLAVVFLALFVRQRQWLKLTVFFLLVFAIFSPWIIRNYQLYKEFIPFNASVGYNLWVGNHPGASGEMVVDYQPIIDYNENHSPLEVNREGIKQSELFALQHPAEFIKITLKRISIFFSFARPTGFWPNFSKLQTIITVAFSSIYSVIIFTFGLAGIWLAFKNTSAPQKNLLKYFLWLALMVPLGVIFILVETRYRYPLYPFLAIFGGYAIFFARQNFRKTRLLLTSVFLVLLANTAFDVFSNLERIFKYLGK